MNRSRIGLSAVMVAVTAVGLARGADNPFQRGVEDRFGIGVGAFVLTLNTGARLEGEILEGGSDIDLEEDLGFSKDDTTARLDMYWRLAPRHRLDLSAFLIRRSAERTLERQIQWGDVAYDVGARVRAEAGNDIIKLAYKYSFVRSDRLEVCGSIGVSTWLVTAKIEGEGRVTTPDGVVVAERASESRDLTAPVPMIGVLAEWRVAPGWFLRGSAEYVAADVGDTEASLGDYRLDLNWFPFERWGFGVGYNWVDLEYEDLGQPQVDADAGFDGALMYVSYVY